MGLEAWRLANIHTSRIRATSKLPSRSPILTTYHRMPSPPQRIIPTRSHTSADKWLISRHQILISRLRHLDIASDRERVKHLTTTLMIIWLTDQRRCIEVQISFQTIFRSDSQTHQHLCPHEYTLIRIGGCSSLTAIMSATITSHYHRRRRRWLLYPTSSAPRRFTIPILLLRLLTNPMLTCPRLSATLSPLRTLYTTLKTQLSLMAFSAPLTSLPPTTLISARNAPLLLQIADIRLQVP